jgi:ribose-phosphate pyrophosphokinase
VILLSGTANPALAAEVASRVGVPLAACVTERFPDGELHVELRESVRGRKVFLLQSTSPPVEQHLFELLLFADACRRAGARERIAVIPYFGYARQDRRAKGRDPIGARVVADILTASGVDRVVVLDLHSRAAEGFFSIPAEHLSAVSLLAKAIRPEAADNPVVVAPDLGAVKLADRYGSIWGCPSATIHKVRLSGSEVKARQIVGEVRDRSPVIVDDMISTGGTVAAAVRALIAAGCRPNLTVVATHGVFAGPVAHVLRDLPIARIATTDTVTPPTDLGLPVQVVSVAPVLADVIARLDLDQSVDELISHG